MGIDFLAAFPSEFDERPIDNADLGQDLGFLTAKDKNAVYNRTCKSWNGLRENLLRSGKKGIYEGDIPN